MEIAKKAWPDLFRQVLSGQKTYDLRLADWECSPGDVLILKEWDPEKREYTGRELRKKVGYVGNTKDLPKFWPEKAVEEQGFQIISLLDE